MLNQTVTINSRKFDGKINRTWQAELIEQKDSLLVFFGVFKEEIIHPDLGIIRRGTLSYEFYWLDRWYNIFRFHEPEGELRCFYCNINLPPKFENNALDYVDLDLDILVWRDFSFEILDLDEFARHSQIYRYPEDLILKSRQTLEEIQNLIRSRDFPFQ